MDSAATIQYLTDKAIVAIVRADKGGDQLLRVIEAIASGGVHCVEVTMTTPGALACLEAAVKRFDQGDVLLGVGTVLDGKTCRAAIDAGAQYIVTPTFSVDVIQTARDSGIPILSGAYTPTEILAAWDAGADMVKVFPSTAGGPEYIKAIKGPLPHIPLVPTGGVTLENIAGFLKAGASAVGVGGNLVSKALIKAGAYDQLTENARLFANAVAASRG